MTPKSSFKIACSALAHIHNKETDHSAPATCDGHRDHEALRSSDTACFELVLHIPRPWSLPLANAPRPRPCLPLHEPPFFSRRIVFYFREHKEYIFCFWNSGGARWDVLHQFALAGVVDNALALLPIKALWKGIGRGLQ